MKKQSNEKVEKTLLIISRILYLLCESWFSFCLTWDILDDGFKEVVHYDTNMLILFVVLALIMTVIEVKRVRKDWNKKGISRRTLVVESVLILVLPLFGFFLIYFVGFPILSI